MGQMGHRTFCSFQLYPKTLLLLSSTCMHMPTSVTLGIAGEFSTVCFHFFCAVGLDAAVCTSNTHYKEGIRKILQRAMKLLWGWIP